MTEINISCNIKIIYSEKEGKSKSLQTFSDSLKKHKIKTASN